jgi:hypothetical protein
MLVLRDDPSNYANLTPDQWGGLLAKYEAWSTRIASEGRLLDGKKLTDGAGKVLRMNGGKLSVKDGPFAETKEVVGGFYLLRADSYDHAVKLCNDHPAFATNGTVEIREVDFMGQPEE